jgi:hypothetical protein
VHIDPRQFGLKGSPPTEYSDCYALGVVICETVNGNLPFHEDTDIRVFAKVQKGKHSFRGAKFKKGLWRMLERCRGLNPATVQVSERLFGVWRRTRTRHNRLCKDSYFIM